MARKKSIGDVFKPEKWYNQSDFLKAAFSGETLIFGRKKRGRLEIKAINDPTDNFLHSSEKSKEKTLLLRNSSEASPFHILLNGVFLGTIKPGETIQIKISAWQKEEHKNKQKFSLEIRDFAKRKRWKIDSNGFLRMFSSLPNRKFFFEKNPANLLEREAKIKQMQNRLDQLFKQLHEIPTPKSFKTPPEREKTEKKTPEIAPEATTHIKTFLINFLFPEIISFKKLFEQPDKTSEAVKPENKNQKILADFFAITLSNALHSLIQPNKKQPLPDHNALDLIKKVFTILDKNSALKNKSDSEKAPFIKNMEKTSTNIQDELFQMLANYSKRLDILLNNPGLKQRFVELLKLLMDKLGVENAWRIIYELLFNLEWFDDYLRYTIYCMLQNLPADQKFSTASAD